MTYIRKEERESERREREREERRKGERERERGEERRGEERERRKGERERERRGGSAVIKLSYVARKEKGHKGRRQAPAAIAKSGRSTFSVWAAIH
jgi:hypothetical protein